MLRGDEKNMVPLREGNQELQKLERLQIPMILQSSLKKELLENVLLLHHWRKM